MNLGYKYAPMKSYIKVNSWFLTITLDPRLYKKSINEQYLDSYMMVRNILKMYSDSFVISCELTKNSNLHYHVIIHFEKDHYKHHIIDLLKRYPLGNSKINETVVSDIERTFNYLIKDIDITSQFIHRPISKYVKKVKLPSEECAFGAGPKAPALARVADSLNTSFLELILND